MQRGSSVLVLATVLFSTHAYADPLQKSEDIVKFFAGAADHGLARGICVGTEDECKSKTGQKDKPPEKTGLDMLINFDLNSAELHPSRRAPHPQRVRQGAEGRAPARRHLRRRRLYRRFRRG